MNFDPLLYFEKADVPSLEKVNFLYFLFDLKSLGKNWFNFLSNFSDQNL